MKAMVLDRYGGAELLKYSDVAKPAPGPGQVLVRIHATSVNPGYLKRADGSLRGILPDLEFPWIPGSDFSGEIEQLGPGVVGVGVGDAVFGFGGTGSYAEFSAVNADAIALKPAGFSHQQAAALAVVAQTAAQCLDAVQLQAGQRILILGAGGAVGSVAVQLAKIRGARVLAVSRTRSVERLRSLGADELVNTDTTQFESVAKGVDAVLDALGGDFERRALAVLKPNGVLVAITGPPSQENARQLGVRALFLNTQSRGNLLAKLSKQMDQGKVTPFIGATYPLSESARAWQEFKSGRVEGKFIITVVNER